MSPRKKQKLNRALLAIGESKRTQITIAERIAAPDWHHSNKRSQTKALRHFKAIAGFEKLSQWPINRWFTVQPIPRELFQVRHADSVRANPMKHPELEQCMSAWIDQMEQMHVRQLTGDLIKDVAAQFNDKLGIPFEERVALSNGRLRKFKQRQTLQLFVFQSETVSAPLDAILPQHKRVAQVISSFLEEDSRRSLDDVWNADETSFLYAYTPDRGLVRAK